jgi:phosphoribosylglycinamide formyltransferase-1
MSFSNNETLISESIVPAAGSFNAAAMASGIPGVPMEFRWRGDDYRVTKILDSWKNLRSCRSGSGEQYINKHFFLVETDAGAVMTLYRTRSGSKKDTWMLYTIHDSPQTAEGAQPMRIAVLVSGGGTNLQALIDAQEKAGCYEIALVIADRENIFALERANRHGIAARLALPPKGIPRPEARLAVSAQVLALAREFKVDALVLAGFLTIMGGDVISEYSNRIINIHPALLPKFGGKGMWGHHVHEAVLASGDRESGCTVHLVDAGCDTGETLLQRRVPVLDGDTPDSLAKRIFAEEHIAIVEGVCLLAAKTVATPSQRG